MSTRMSRSLVVVPCVVTLLGISAYAIETVHSIAFETVTADGGIVPEGRDAYLRFEFHNNSHRSASIRDVAGSCGIFASLIKGRTLGYGEVGAVEARINTAGRQGLLTGTVSVTIRDPFERTVLLSVKTFVEREFVMDKSVVDFGEIPGAAYSRRELTIRVTSKDYKVLRARSTDETFAAHVDAQQAPGSATVVVITNPVKEPGLKRGTIRMSTSSPDMPELIVPVRAVITDPSA